MRDLLDAERRRYTDLLDTLEVSPEAPDRLRAAARRVDDLRFAAARAPSGTTRRGAARVELGTTPLGWGARSTTRTVRKS